MRTNNYFERTTYSNAYTHMKLSNIRWAVSARVGPCLLGVRRLFLARATAFTKMSRLQRIETEMKRKVNET